MPNSTDTPKNALPQSADPECDGVGGAHSIRLMAWSFAWASTMVLIDKAELYQWYDSRLISAVAIALNTLIGLGMVAVFIRYLKAIDELQRKIQFDALAIAMGTGLVGGFTYSLMVTAGFVGDAEVSDLILMMTVAYMLSIIGGRIRYR